MEALEGLPAGLYRDLCVATLLGGIVYHKHDKYDDDKL